MLGGEEPPMSDADPFIKASEDHQAELTRCRFCPSVEKLSPSRRRLLYDAMFGVTRVNGKRITHKTVIGVLEGWDIKVSASIISKHTTGVKLNDVCRAAVLDKWGAAE